MEIKITVKFKISQAVFRKCDPDKNKYFVVSYLVDGKDVLYTVNGIEGRLTLYHFEIADYDERLAVMN